MQKRINFPNFEMFRYMGFTSILILVGILSYAEPLPSACVRCKKQTDCVLPKCVCCSEEMPLRKEEVPQMVFFTFDDAVNTHIAGFYRQLFHSNRKNPNGCPISMTLFISHANTVYTLVREFYQKGMEIASHSVSHGHPSTSTFLKEAKRQKDNLARMARIPSTRIKGWRSPFLEPLGDAQPNLLQSLGYAYDATLTYTKGVLDKTAPLPFTLDYGWPYKCNIKPCPRKKHKGFWEVPVVSLKDYLGKYECVYVDGCTNPPPDEESAFNFLWENFQTYYKTNKAPFGINMHAAWFFHGDRLKAMDRFIKELVKLDDVYIVSVKQVIQWLQNPSPLAEIGTFKPWSCKSSNSSSSFHLRNKQIQKRIREKQESQKEKQQAEVSRRHREWSNNQNSETSGTISKVTPTKHGNNIKRKFSRQPAKETKTVSSPGSSWQSLLSHYARKQQSLSRNYPRKTIKNTDIAKPSEKPRETIAEERERKNKERLKLIEREKIRKLKENKRIRQQQQLAAKKRKQIELQRIISEKQKNIDKKTQTNEGEKPRQIQESNKQQKTETIYKSNQYIFTNVVTTNTPQHNYKSLVQKKSQEFQDKPPHIQENNNSSPKEAKGESARKEKHQSIHEKKDIVKQNITYDKTSEGTYDKTSEGTYDKTSEGKLTLHTSPTTVKNVIEHNENNKRNVTVESKVEQKPNPMELQKKDVTTEQYRKNILEKPKTTETHKKKTRRQRLIHKQRIDKLKQIIKQKLMKTKTLALRKLKENKSIKMMNKHSKAVTINAVIAREIKDFLRQEPWRSWLLAYRQKRKEEPKYKSVNTKKKQSENNIISTKVPAVNTNSNQNTAKNISGPDLEINMRLKHLNTPTSNIRIQNQNISVTTPDSAYTTTTVNIKPFDKSRRNETPTLKLPNFPESGTVRLGQAAGGLVAHTVTKSFNGRTVDGLGANITVLPTGKEVMLSNGIIVSKSSVGPQKLGKIRPKINSKLSEFIEFDIQKQQRKAGSLSETTMSPSPTETTRSCIQNINCIAPECICKTDKTPLGFPSQKLPQIIYLTIEGNINFLSYSKMKSLFTKSRKNPNGCRIGGTFFVSDMSSSYRLANILNKDGIEISLHGITSTQDKSTKKISMEIHDQIQKLVANGIPAKDIKGWRSSKFESFGDPQFDIMQNNSLFDSSLLTNRSAVNERKLWPFTLDFGWNEPCSNSICPTKSHPGVWEIPVTPVVSYDGLSTCNHVDTCDMQPKNEDETFKFLMDNFNSYYKTNKAPFGIHISQKWFYWYFNRNLAGLSRFLDTVRKKNDIYIVSISKMIEWMKSPTTIDQIRDFKPWQC